MFWPASAEDLIARQWEIAGRQPTPWTLPDGEIVFGGCFVAFARGIEGPGEKGDPAWAAAVLVRDGMTIAEAGVRGTAGAPYEAGLLALREGALLEAAVRALPSLPGFLLVNASGWDHPRRCGLAVDLGAVLGVPTAGVTHRALLATGPEPADEAGSASPLRLEGETVAYWLRTRRRARPLAVHAGWRTSPATALEAVRRASSGSRTPEPLRRARELARLARHEST